MYCKKCGIKQREGYVFCPNCGTPYPVEKESVTSPLIDNYNQINEGRTKEGNKFDNEPIHEDTMPKDESTSYSKNREEVNRAYDSLKVDSPLVDLRDIYNLLEKKLLEFGRKYLSTQILNYVCYTAYAVCIIQFLHYVGIFQHFIGSIIDGLLLILYTSLLLMLYKSFNKSFLLPMLLVANFILMIYDFSLFQINIMIGYGNKGSSLNLFDFQAIIDSFVNFTYLGFVLVCGLKILLTKLNKIGVMMVISSFLFLIFVFMHMLSYVFDIECDKKHPNMFLWSMWCVDWIGQIAQVLNVYYIHKLVVNNIDSIIDKSNNIWFTSKTTKYEV